MLSEPETESCSGRGASIAHALALLVLLLAVAAHGLPRRSGPIDLHYDGATYYVLGASLATGSGYRLLNEPGEIEALQYPPLFPLWIAAHMRLCGSVDPAEVAPVLRRTSLLLALVHAWAIYFLARRHVAGGFALCVALLCTLSFRTIYLGELLFPELLFGTVSVLFFLALGARHGRWRGWAGPLAMAAFLLRSAGLTLLVVWCAEALLARAWRTAALRALLAALPLLAWQAHVARVEASAAYRTPAYAYQRAPYQYYNVSYGRNLFLIDPFAPERGPVGLAGLARRVGENASHLPTFVGEQLLAPLSEWVWPVREAARALGFELEPSRALLRVLTLGGVVALLGLAGLALGGVRGPPLHVLLSLGLITLTPWQAQFWRYLAPVMPFLALGFAWSVAWAWRAVGAHPRARIPLRALLGAVLLVALGAQVKATRSMFVHNWRAFEWTTASGVALRGRAFHLEREWDALEEALAWLRARGERGAVVACSAPQLAYLGTGLRAVLPPFEPDPAHARELLDTVPVRYLITDELAFLDVARRYVQPMLAMQPESWELAYRARAPGSVAVWRRR